MFGPKMFPQYCNSGTYNVPATFSRMKGETDEPWRRGSNSTEWSTWVAMSSSSVKTKTKRSSFTIVGDMLRMVGKTKMAINLSKYDFIGFDMDNTLCTYNLKNLFTNHFNYLITFLNGQNTRKYNVSMELTPHLVDFMSRGLIIDIQKGNLLKVAADGEILRASHGTQMMSLEDIDGVYGPSRKWQVLDNVIAEGFANWRSKHHEIYSFMDFTDSAFSAVYALAIDSGHPPHNVWLDVIEGIKVMYSDQAWMDDCFANNRIYMNKTNEKVVNWMRSLKKQVKIGMITSNHSHLVPKIAEICLGPDWTSLFDVLVFDAKKPGFFTGNSPFLDMAHEEVEFKMGGTYNRGSMRILQDVLNKSLNKQARCAYIGDSPFHDFMFTEIDYVAIVEELKAEHLVPGTHPSSEFISSTIWGSYLYEGDRLTLFGKYALGSKFCAPDVDFFSDHKVNYDFHSQLPKT